MVPKGTHIFDKKVNYYQSNKIDLEFFKRVPFHVDGELYYSSTFDVKIIPSALNAIYNPEGDHFLEI